MKLKKLITIVFLITSGSTIAAIYDGQEAATQLAKAKDNKKSVIGFKCKVTKKYVSNLVTKKDFLSGKTTVTPHYKTQTVNDITCNIKQEMSLERIRTSSAEIGTIELESDVDVLVMLLGKAGNNKNTGARNLNKAVMTCDDRAVTMTATFDRVSERIETAMYTSKQGTRGDVIMLNDARANRLPNKKWASVNLLTNCKAMTE